MSELNIYQRINAVMKECPYIQKEQAQQGKGVKYDTVVSMIRPLMIKHGIVTVTRQTEMENLGLVEGTKQKVYQGKYELDLVNIDKPDDRVTLSMYAQGMDGGDKGPGKAQTYAVKAMLVKGFLIETGEDEESRSEKMAATITKIQANTIESMLKGCDEIKEKMFKHLSVSDVYDILKSDYDRTVAAIRAEKRNANL
jgi:hypothetical protein